jgi:hypothetical protein
MWQPPTPWGAKLAQQDADRSAWLDAWLRQEGDGKLIPVRAQRMAETRAGIQQTECPKGHLFDEANIYWHDGLRYCRRCRTERERERRAANPERERERQRRRRAAKKIRQQGAG